MEKLGQKICLDTDFLVNFLRNKPVEIEFIKNNEKINLIATTYINVFELFHGAYKSSKPQKNIDALNLLFQRIKVLNLSLESTNLAGQIIAELEKQGNMIDYRDLLIGSIALANNFSIKTNNIKDFNRIIGLNLLD